MQKNTGKKLKNPSQKPVSDGKDSEYTKNRNFYTLENKYERVFIGNSTKGGGVCDFNR